MSVKDGSRPVLFEIGCGVGNTIFPVRRENPQLFVHACDLSQRAVAFVQVFVHLSSRSYWQTTLIVLVQEHEEYSGEDCHAFVCDLSVEDVTEHVPVETVDVVSAFFVLSAMSLEEMHHVVCNIRKVNFSSST